MKLNLLLSYARKDGLAASTKLRYELVQVGYEVWRDIEEMRGGKLWQQQIRDAIAQVDVIIVLLTPGSQTSQYVAWECETAQLLKKALIGILIEPCDVIPALSDLHYHDLSSIDKYTLGFANLVRDLREREINLMSHDDDRMKSSSYFSGARDIKIDRSQFGNQNSMINGSNQTLEDNDLMYLINKITTLITTEHNELRSMLVSELTSMKAEERSQLALISEKLYAGAITQPDIQDFLVNVRDFIVSIQNDVNTSNEKLQEIAHQVEQVFAGEVSQENRFELTLPIVPGIFEYKHSFGTSWTLDIRNLVERLQRYWVKWTQ